MKQIVIAEGTVQEVRDQDMSKKHFPFNVVQRFIGCTPVETVMEQLNRADHLGKKVKLILEVQDD